MTFAHRFVVKLSTIFVIGASFAATVHGAQVQFFTNKACDSPSQTYRGGCNFCADPPGGTASPPFTMLLMMYTMLTSFVFVDWGAVRFSDIPSNYRVTVHNQNKCTTKSQVGQGYGAACWRQGATKIRSAWVACPNQK